MTTRNRTMNPYDSGAIEPHPEAGAIEAPARPGARHDSDPDGLSAPSSTSPRYHSEVEPMDVILKKLADAPPMVPNSMQPGVSKQAVHAPAHAYGGAEPSERLVYDPPPDWTRADPEPRVGDTALTSPRRGAPPRRTSGGLYAALTLVAVGLLASPFWVLAHRSPESPALQANEPTPPPTSPTPTGATSAPETAAPPAVETSTDSRSSRPGPTRPRPEPSPEERPLPPSRRRNPLKTPPFASAAPSQRASERSAPAASASHSAIDEYIRPFTP